MESEGSETMNLEPRQREDYSDRQIEAAFRVLVDLGQVLKSFEDCLVVVGGWVPDLLMEKAEEAHVGSIDVDLALDAEKLADGKYAGLLKALKPYPLQYEGEGRNITDMPELKLDEFRTSKTESFRRLRAYYAQLGFERIGRSEFYVLCTKKRTPSLKELSIPDCFTVPAEFIKNCAAISKPAKI
jgi:hypothetical protein